MAQQFIDGPARLRELGKREPAPEQGKPEQGKPDKGRTEKEEAEKQRPKKPQPETFRLSAMVETWDSHLRLKLGQPLFPSRMSCHRLYLKDGENREAGYLSFSDDRLYYGVIPLMEQRRVQVRAEVSGHQPAKRGRGRNYYNLDLWLRLLPEESRKQPEDLGRQIEDLLKKY